MVRSTPSAASHNLDSKQDLQMLQAMLAAGHWKFENLSSKLNNF
jgi:RecB family exonuclease